MKQASSRSCVWVLTDNSGETIRRILFTGGAFSSTMAGAARTYLASFDKTTDTLTSWIAPTTIGASYSMVEINGGSTLFLGDRPVDPITGVSYTY